MVYVSDILNARLVLCDPDAELKRNRNKCEIWKAYIVEPFLENLVVFFCWPFSEYSHTPVDTSVSNVSRVSICCFTRNSLYSYSLQVVLDFSWKYLQQSRINTQLPKGLTCFQQQQTC